MSGSPAITQTSSATLLDGMAADRNLEAALARLREPQGHVSMGGAAEGSWGLLAWQILRTTHRSVLVVAPDPAAVVDGLAALDGVPRPLFYPEADVLPADRRSPSDEVTAARLVTESTLLRDPAPVLVVTSPKGLMRPAPAPAAFRAGLFDVKPGQHITPNELGARLLDWGYVRVPQVEAPGQFAARGGIVDVSPPGDVNALRLEFLGDEIESIRGFDIDTQASVTRPDHAVLIPAREFPLREEDAPALLQSMLALDLGACLPEVRARWSDDIARLREAGYFPGVESLIPYATAPQATLMDYFAAPPVVVLLEPERLRTAAARTLQDAEDLLADEGAHGELPRGLRAGLAALSDIEAGWTSTVSLQRVATEGSIALDWAAPAGRAGQEDALAADLRVALAQGDRCLLITRQPRRAMSGLEQRGIAVDQLETLDPQGTALTAGATHVWEGGLQSGFTVQSAGLRVYTDLELFGTTYRPRVRPPSSVPADERAAFHLEVEPGKLVVHRDHGIGRFVGLRSIGDSGPAREYIHLEYAGGDRVFVPVEYMDRVQVYLGGGDDAGSGASQPRLSRLGTAEWARIKGKVRRAVAEMADELLHIYARRAVAEGSAFAPDGVWQSELEASFQFEETPDQLRAMDEIKADMETASPMDRLLCGDVGFGKTELALRAAFKAAVDGKQVAVLVPTTVLANQHFLTFSERLKPFPLRVEMLSRFRSESDRDIVREGLRNGTVDIVIGTHSLLTGKVKFKDLGLLVIDEEQRFGVAQKEKIKRLRASVDVLSMSATPIPRTLHMALGGIRDLSVLATAPEARLPVRSIVTADTDPVVRDAIMRELNRKGQTFFVHNRVQTIRRSEERVRKLVPEARVAVAHGQMDEQRLAQVMLDFVRREYDVLVCTTIIESGLDIPTANTILVQNADRFGLADLYQLRGRVGRSDIRAYAYFLYDKDRSLTEHADKRLDVIAEYQELGAGFKLAMRDLEIRGAGNLLGREQSGEIAAVGLEMYNEMLRDAVAALKGDLAPPIAEEAPAVAPLELPIAHYLPADYVPDEKVRLQVYQELAAAGSDTGLSTMARRLRDRFGAAPAPVENLVYALRVKLAAEAAGLRALAIDGESLELRLPPGHGRDLGSLAVSHRNVTARPNRLRFAWQAAGGDWQEELLRVLEELARLSPAA
jgi:transcription-repair coupling factor (superfamily II helicase)